MNPHHDRPRPDPGATVADLDDIGRVYTTARSSYHTADRLHAAFLDHLASSSLTTGLLEVWERNTDYLFLRLSVG